MERRAVGRGAEGAGTTYSRATLFRCLYRLRSFYSFSIPLSSSFFPPLRVLSIFSLFSSLFFSSFLVSHLFPLIYPSSVSRVELLPPSLFPFSLDLCMFDVSLRYRGSSTAYCVSTRVRDADGARELGREGVLRAAVFRRELVAYLESKPERSRRAWGRLYAIGLFTSTPAGHLREYTSFFVPFLFLWACVSRC